MAARPARKLTTNAPVRVAPKPAAAPINPADLDRLIHDRMRLGILSALAASESLSFIDLRTTLGATDGNLSVHARKLEDAGYISCRKGFDGRTPRTAFTLTATGRRALERYLDHMDALIRSARKARS